MNTAHPLAATLAQIHRLSEITPNPHEADRNG